MPRRDRDDRPPIEVFGGAPDVASTSEVDIGGDERSTRRWWWLVATAVAVIGGAVAFGGDDGAEPAARSTTTTPAHRSTSTGPTTSTVPAPLGPILPEPTGGALVFVRERGPWRVVDLDTGSQRDLAPLPSPTDVFGSVSAVRGGLVSVGSGLATFHPILTDGRPAQLGEASGVVASGDPTRVWLTRSDVDGSPVDLRLVDLGGRTHSRVVTTGGYFGATVDGVLTGSGGRVYLTGPDGQRELGVGVPAGAGSGSTVVIDTCDEGARCGPVLVDTSTGERRRVDGFWGPLRESSHQYVLTADGSLLQMAYGIDGLTLRWADPSGRVIAVTKGIGEGMAAVGDLYGLGFNGEPVGLPLGLGVLGLQGGGRLVRVHPDGRGAVRADELPTPAGVEADRVLLVMP